MEGLGEGRGGGGKKRIKIIHRLDNIQLFIKKYLTHFKPRLWLYPHFSSMASIKFALYRGLIPIHNANMAMTCKGSANLEADVRHVWGGEGKVWEGEEKV